MKVIVIKFNLGVKYVSNQGHDLYSLRGKKALDVNLPTGSRVDVEDVLPCMGI